MLGLKLFPSYTGHIVSLFNYGSLTRKVSQVSLADFNDSLICCRASKNKTHVIFFIGGKTVLGGEIDP